MYTLIILVVGMAIAGCVGLELSTVGGGLTVSWGKGTNKTSKKLF